MAICKKHKIVHETRMKSQHFYEKLGMKLTIQQIEKIVDNILPKIKVANKCVNQIIKETSRLSAKITDMCMQAIKRIKEKQQHYSILLGLCQKRLLGDQIKEIERHSKTFLQINIPTYEFKEIEKFYSSDFLKEYNKVKYIASMPLEDAIPLLTEDYGLFLEGHTA